MRKAMGAFIGAFVFALFTFLSLQAGYGSWMLSPVFILIWSVPGVLIGYVLAMEKRWYTVLKRKGALIGACVLGVPNFFLAITLVSTGGEATWPLLLIDTPLMGLLCFPYSSFAESLSLLFVVFVLLMWGLIGAAIGALIQKMDERAMA